MGAAGSRTEPACSQRDAALSVLRASRCPAVSQSLKCCWWGKMRQQSTAPGAFVAEELVSRSKERSLGAECCSACNSNKLSSVWERRSKVGAPSIPSEGTKPRSMRSCHHFPSLPPAGMQSAQGCPHSAQHRAMRSVRSPSHCASPPGATGSLLLKYGRCFNRGPCERGLIVGLLYGLLNKKKMLKKGRRKRREVSGDLVTRLVPIAGPCWLSQVCSAQGLLCCTDNRAGNNCLGTGNTSSCKRSLPLMFAI